MGRRDEKKCETQSRGLSAQERQQMEDSKDVRREEPVVPSAHSHMSQHWVSQKEVAI